MLLLTRLIVQQHSTPKILEESESFRKAVSPGRNPKLITAGKLHGGLMFRALK